MARFPRPSSIAPAALAARAAQLGRMADAAWRLVERARRTGGGGGVTRAVERAGELEELALCAGSFGTGPDEDWGIGAAWVGV